MVLTHAYWQGRYGGSPDVIGRRLVINDQPFTLVGVMPPDLAYPRGVEGWITVAACASTLTNPIFREAVRNELDLLGRLRVGATPEQAESELRGLIARLEADATPPGRRGLLPVLRSYESLVVGDVPGAILALFGAVALVLVIASANVANLLLLRVQSRRAELALRAALGAGRARLAGQLLAESLLLAAVAGAIGLALAKGTLRVVVALVPGGLPRGEAVRVDPVVVLFTIGLALLVAALAGLAPALACARTDLVSQLRGGRGGAGASGTGRSRRLLVAAQVALAVTVVAVAGVLIRSLLRLQTVDTGLSADRLVVVSLALPQPKYADPSRHRQLLDDLVAQLEGAPSIEAATPVNAPPFAGQGWDAPEFTADGQDPERARGNPSLNVEAIHPNHFRTLGVPLLRGRAFSDADRSGAVEVAIVSEDVATRTWPGENAIGKRLRIGGPDSREPWRTLVGVVKPTRYRELTDPRPTLYLPAAQFIVSAQSLVLRSAAPLSSVAGLARERVRALDPELRVMRVASFAEMREVPLARPRWNALLIGLFGVTALLLTAIGLYAVVGASVRQRSSEIGVRMALGATAADVRRLVLAEALRLAAAGAAIGLGERSRRAEWSVASCSASIRSIPRRCSARRCCSSALRLSLPGFPRAGPRVSIPRRSCALSEPAQPGSPFASGCGYGGDR